jgi:hypothetical protein
MNNRIQLTSDLYKRNVVDFEDFSELIIKTLEQVQEDILPLSGKNALLDIVVFKDSATSYLNNVFSNDGIHILKNTEYINPIQTYIVNYIRHIAERVEDAASDGTSTAIFTAASFIKNAFKELKHMREYSDTVYNTMSNTVDIKNKIVQGLIDTQAKMKKQALYLNDLSRDDKEKAIYQLALTTSKGNEIMAQCAVDLFMDIPEVLYKYVSYQRSEIETDIDISIEKVEHDFALAVNPSANIEYNAHLSTELHYDLCDVVLIPNVNSVNVKSLLSYLDKNYTGDNNVIVVVNGADDHTNVFLEKELGVREIPFCKTVAFLPSFVNNPLELNILQVVSGLNIIDPLAIADFDKSTIKNVKCQLRNRTLYFYNLFENNDSILHPSYLNKDHKDYTKLCSELEKRINNLENKHEVKNVQQDLNEFVRLYSSMVCSRLPKLVIGGSSINHLYNINVVDDVLGVVSVALKEGVIFDTIPKLMNYLPKDIFPDVLTDLKEFYKVTSGSFISISDTVDIDPDDFFISPNKWRKVSFSKLNVVQSFKSIDELFNRIIETIPYLICTDRIIVRDGIMEKEE